MSRLARFTQKIFGSAAGSNQISQFGSLAAGSPVFTTALNTIQALSNFATGWFGGVVGGNSPAIEDMNALFYLITSQLAYLFQQGVAEWDTSTVYYTGCIVQDSSGILYRSLTDTNTGNTPSSSPSNWGALTALAVSTGNGTAGAAAYGFTAEANTGMYLASAGTLKLTAGGSDAFTADSVGNGTVRNTIFAANGSAGGPSHSFTVDQNTGMYRASSGTLALATGGVDALIADTTRLDVKTTSGLRFDGLANPFKIKVFTGTLTSSASTTLTAPSGVLFSVSGWSQNNTDYKAMITGDVAAACSIVRGVVFNGAGNLSTAVTITNLEASSRTYCVVMFYG